MAEVNEDWTTTGVSAATPGSTDGADKPVVCVLLQQAKSSNETRVIVGVLGEDGVTVVPGKPKKLSKHDPHVRRSADPNERELFK